MLFAKSSEVLFFSSLKLCVYIVMDKNIGTIAVLSENATLLRNFLQLRNFWVLTFLFFGLKQHKKAEEKSNLILRRNPKVPWPKLLAHLT